MYYKSAKYRTLKFRTIVDPLFPYFLNHHCLQILYTTNFLRENAFCILFHYYYFLISGGPYNPPDLLLSTIDLLYNKD